MGDEAAEKNFGGSKYVSPFESSNVPEIAAGLYFSIICHKLKMDEEHTIAILVLLNRVANMTECSHERIYCWNSQPTPAQERLALQINSLTIHRLILVTILTVHKYYNDHFYLNSYLAHIGGLELKELNHLERMFLEILDFNLSIDIEEYESYRTGLEAFFSNPLSPNVIEIKRNIDEQIE